MTKAKFANGERVVLLPFEDEPRQEGVIEGYEGNNLYIVRVDQRYISRGDDGLREVDVAQLRKKGGTTK